MQDGAQIAFASRALTDCETRYAQIEKEMLAIVFACEKFAHYIYNGQLVTVQSDHKPLESLFKKSIAVTIPRLQLTCVTSIVKISTASGLPTWQIHVYRRYIISRLSH